MAGDRIWKLDSGAYLKDIVYYVYLVQKKKKKIQIMYNDIL